MGLKMSISDPRDPPQAYVEAGFQRTIASAHFNTPLKLELLSLGGSFLYSKSDDELWHPQFTTSYPCQAIMWELPYTMHLKKKKSALREQSTMAQIQKPKRRFDGI